MFFSPSASSSGYVGTQQHKTTLICTLPNDCPPLVLNVPSLLTIEQSLAEVKRKAEQYYSSCALPGTNDLSMQVQVTDEITANVYKSDIVGEIFQTNPAPCIIAIDGQGKKRKAPKGK